MKYKFKHDAKNLKELADDLRSQGEGEELTAALAALHVVVHFAETRNLPVLSEVLGIVTDSSFNKASEIAEYLYHTGEPKRLIMIAMTLIMKEIGDVPSQAS